MQRLSKMDIVMILHIVLLSILSIFIFHELAGMTPAKTRQEKSFEKKEFHFIMVYQEEKSPYWDMVKDGVRTAAVRDDVFVEFIGPETTDMVEQVDMLNRAIASRVDGIIVQGMNEEAFTPVINKAVQLGIPVLTIDSDAPQSKRSTYVGSNNYQAGVLAGQYLADMLQGKGDVGIILGNFYATNQKQRLRGIQDAVSKHPGITIVSVQDSNANQFMAASLTMQLLQNYPALDAVVGLSPWDGPGIGQAMKRTKKDGHTKVIAFDLLPETNVYLHEGTIDTVIYEEPFRMGFEAVENMVKLKKGHKVPAHIYTQVQLVTAEQVQHMQRR